MQVVYECCCGLDVHKTKVVACLITSGKGGRPPKEIRTFGTTTGELNLLSDWLSAAGCTHVAMESTGVYWKPVYYILEGNFELLGVNARDVKQVPGRKTDVSDAEWIADLLRHGLLRGSFVPPKPIRELRALTRHRKTWVREKARAINRIQKVLEDANIKLASVASNILGASGRAILQALAQGANDTCMPWRNWLRAPYVPNWPKKRPSPEWWNPTTVFSSSNTWPTCQEPVKMSCHGCGIIRPAG